MANIGRTVVSVYVKTRTLRTVGCVDCLTTLPIVLHCRSVATGVRITYGYYDLSFTTRGVFRLGEVQRMHCRPAVLAPSDIVVAWVHVVIAIHPVGARRHGAF